MAAAVADRQRRLRTQEELAERAGVSVATIIRLEDGKPGRISNVRKIAEALGVSADELIGEEQQPRQQKVTALVNTRAAVASAWMAGDAGDKIAGEGLGKLERETLTPSSTN